MKRAGRLLIGSRLTAAAVQLLLIGARLLNLLAQLLLLRVTGLAAERVVTVSRLWNGEWLYGLVLLFALAADWLLISPLLLGRTACYCRIARGEGMEFALLFRFFGKGYGSALGWRLRLFLRRLFWSGVCLLPAAVTAAYAGIVRDRGADTPLADVTLLFCSLLGIFFLLAGLVAAELLMTRYQPAPFLLVTRGDVPGKVLFRAARRTMRTHIGETVWLYLGFAGWLAASAAVVPYFYAAPLFHTTRAIVFTRYIAEREQQKAEDGGRRTSGDTLSFDVPKGDFVKLPHGLT